MEKARIPDATMANKMGISPQAVSKIRTKLEDKGIITKYQPVIDFKKIGIGALALLVVNLKDETWAEYSEDQINDRIRKIPYVIGAYRIVEPDASHILLMGFSDLNEMDEILKKIQTKFFRELDIQHAYPFVVDKVITQSPVGLLYQILDKKNFPLRLFLKNRIKVILL